MTDATHKAPDDLMTRLKDRLKALYDDPREYSPGQISEASVMALTRIEELEAKLATAMKFVKDFAYRAKTKEHNEDETWLVGESEIRFQRDCDITQARMIIAELKGQGDE